MLKLSALGMLLISMLAFARANVPTHEIAPGVFLPMINLGHPDDNTTETLSAEDWLALGGRGIDTAYSYFNQDEVKVAVGNFIKKGGKRSDVFITTKIDPGRFVKSCTEETSMAAIQEDIKELGMDYVDLLLLHFPCDEQAGGDQGSAAVYKSMQKAKNMGLARAIGISNFNVTQMQALLASDDITVIPAVNQCLMAVGSHDDVTISYCKAKNITYESYSPLRHVDLTNKIITDIADAHNVSAAQVCLRWVVQQGVPLVTSPGGDVDYAKQDLAIFDFVLSTEEMDALSAITS